MKVKLNFQKEMANVTSNATVTCPDNINTLKGTENVTNNMETNTEMYSDIEDNPECTSERDIHEPDDLVDSFNDPVNINLELTMSETIVTNSNYIYTSPVKKEQLNKGLDNICRTCTKLYFPEQGRVIQEKTKLHSSK